MDAAFALFDERGYEETTVDDIAERAGVSRSTFFRLYRSKEDVIFPDHERLMDTIKQRLAISSGATAIVAVSDAVQLVLLRYVEEGERARQRYALTSRVPALRDRPRGRLLRGLRDDLLPALPDRGPDPQGPAALAAAQVARRCASCASGSGLEK